MEILIDAKSKTGDNGRPPSPLQVWANPKLVKAGQDFIRRNFFSVFFAHFISLIFLLCYAPVRRVLTKTGRSDSPTKSIKRYLSTLLHVQEWYEGDLLNLESLTFQDIQRVRRIHSGISKSVKLSPEDQECDCDFKFPDFPVAQHSEKDKTLVLAIQQSAAHFEQESGVTDETAKSRPSNFSISQLDMIVTQYCFMGFISMFPQKLGIHSEESEGLRGFIHLWAVIGNLLGVEDHYNICLVENEGLRKVILDQVLLPDFRKCNPGSLVLWKSLISGLSKYIPFLRLKPVLVFVLKNVLDLSNHESDLDSILSRYEKFCYRAMCMCFGIWLKYWALIKFLNGLLRLAICVAAWRIGVSIDLKERSKQNRIKSVIV